MKELKIGEEIRIRCVESPTDECGNCVLRNLIRDGANNCHALCSAYTREDGKNVHFELVEDNGCPSDETIMRVLNCIGYEERSWIETVKKNWDKVIKED